MTQKALAPLARKLRKRGQELKSAGTFAQIQHGPQLVEETADFLVELAERLDALTPFLDEAA